MQENDVRIQPEELKVNMVLMQQFSGKKATILTIEPARAVLGHLTSKPLTVDYEIVVYQIEGEDKKRRWEKTTFCMNHKPL